MANELSQQDMRRLAMIGAQARLSQIEIERRAILEAFPELTGAAPARRRPGRPQKRAAAEATAEQPAPKRRRRRPRMTAAQRKAVSDRMKKYWADRRKKA